jgi:hypothetical protein
LEGEIFKKVESAELKALKDLQKGDSVGAIKVLSELQEKIANEIVTQWWDFFHLMVAKYHDIVRSVTFFSPLSLSIYLPLSISLSSLSVSLCLSDLHSQYLPLLPLSPPSHRVNDFHAENFASAITWINYRRWWMEFVGFWGQPGQPPKGKLQPEGVNPIAFNAQATPAEYALVYPEGSSTKFYLHSSTSPTPEVPEPAVSPSPVSPPPPNPVNHEGPNGEVDQPEPKTSPVASPTDSPSVTGNGHVTLIGLVCFVLGFLSKYLWDRLCDKTRAGYSPISDSI